MKKLLTLITACLFGVLGMQAADRVQLKTATTFLFNQYYPGETILQNEASTATSLNYGLGLYLACEGKSSAGDRTYKTELKDIQTITKSSNCGDGDENVFAKGNYIGVSTNTTGTVRFNTAPANGTMYSSFGFRTEVAGTVYALVRGTYSSGQSRQVVIIDCTKTESHTAVSTLDAVTPADGSTVYLLKATVAAKGIYQIHSTVGGGCTVYGIKFVPSSDNKDRHEYTVNLTKGTATFSSPNNCSVPTGCKAYAVTSVGTDKVVLGSVTNIPANTGVIIKADDSSTESVTIKSLASASAETTLLTSSVAPYSLPTTGTVSSTTYDNYVLTADGDNMVFKKLTEANSLSADNAYLRLVQSESNPSTLGLSYSLSSIAVKTAPTKVTYTAGEKFDPAGLVITETFSDNSTTDVTYSDASKSSFTFSPTTETTLATTDTKVTITYGGKTVDQAITVNAARTLSSISVKTAPTKTTYTAGEKFDPTGLVIMETFSDNSTADVTYSDATKSGFTFSPTTETDLATTDAKVTITYGGKTVDQAITVNAAPTAHTVTFNAGDHGTYTGGAITETSAGAGVTLPDVTNVTSGYTFSGWATTEGATSADAGAAGATYKPSADCTLYAVYTDNRQESGLTISEGKSSITIAPEGTYTLTKDVDYTTSSDGTITYSSDATGVATVGTDGKITPVAEGTAKITLSQAATNTYKAGSVVFDVTVKQEYAETKKWDFSALGANIPYADNGTTAGGKWYNPSDSQTDRVRNGSNFTSEELNYYADAAAKTAGTTTVYEPTQGLKFTTNNSAYSIEIRSNSVSLSRAGAVITIPGCAKGQKITLTIQAGAASRGFTLVNLSATSFQTDAANTWKTGSFIVSANGDVTLTSDAQILLQSITVETPKVAHTVTFNAGDHGTCGTTSLKEDSYGAGITLPAVTASAGYTFNGWATTETATTVDAGAAGATYNPAMDCTLYAVYTDNRQASDLKIAEGKSSITIAPEGTYTLTKGTDYTTSSTGTITYSSSDETVATVGTDGKITVVAGVTTGTAKITLKQAASDTYSAASVEYTVTVYGTSLVDKFGTPKTALDLTQDFTDQVKDMTPDTISKTQDAEAKPCIVFSAYSMMNSFNSKKITWANVPVNGEKAGGTSDVKNWDANGVFRGGAAYQQETTSGGVTGARYSTVNSSRNYTAYSFRVKGAKKVSALINSVKNTITENMAAYEITDDTAAKTTTLLASDNTGSAATVSLDLDATKEYLVTFDNNSTSNSIIYEIALYSDNLPTLSSIAVKTPPTKTEYYAGKKFDPAGLVITKTYSDETTADVAYPADASAFTFVPSLDTELQTTDTKVTITYQGKSVDQAIAVTQKVKWETPTLTVGDWDATKQAYPVTITGEEGATLKYSTNGTDYSDYSTTVNVAADATIYAKATGGSYTDSEVASKTMEGNPGTIRTVDETTKTTTWDFTAVTQLQGKQLKEWTENESSTYFSNPKYTAATYQAPSWCEGITIGASASISANRLRLYYKKDETTAAQGLVFLNSAAGSMKVKIPTGANTLEIYSDMDSLTTSTEGITSLGTYDTVNKKYSLQVTEGSEIEIHRDYKTGSISTGPCITKIVTKVMDYTPRTVTCNPPSHGTLTAEPTSNVIPGTKVKLTIKADENYALEVLSVKAGEKDVTVASDSSFIMPESDVTVTATFKTASDLKIPEGKSTLTIAPTATYTLTKGTDYTTTSTGTITYSSDKEAVATVGTDGKITAVAEGTAKITLKQAEDNTYTAASVEYTVTVQGTSRADKFGMPTTALDLSSNPATAMTVMIPNGAQITGGTGGRVVFSAYSMMNSFNNGKITWANVPKNGKEAGGTSDIDATSTETANNWDATGDFRGGAAYKQDTKIVTKGGVSSTYTGACYATTNSDRKYTAYSFRVKGANKVAALVNATKSSLSVNMAAYEITEGTAAKTTTLLAKTTTGAPETVTLTLDAAKEYLVTLDNSLNTNSRLYEIALYSDNMPTLSSIGVKTPPTKVAYVGGDKFDPAGLVINERFSDNSTVDVTYSADNASDFTFSPATLDNPTAVTTAYVTIKYIGQGVEQIVTVAPKTSWNKPTFTSADYDGEKYVVTIASETGSKIKYTVGTEAEKTSESNTVTVKAVPATAIKAIATGGTYQDSKDSTYTVPAAQKVEAPTFAVAAYNYNNEGYPVTVSCATEGATLTYSLNGGTYSDVPADGIVYVPGSALFTVKANKKGWTQNSNKVTVNAAPSSTSPETLIPVVVSDGYVKNIAQTYNSVNFSKTCVAGVAGATNTNAFVLRTNQTNGTLANSFVLKVNKDHAITKVELKAYTKSDETGQEIKVAGASVDGTAKADFTEVTLPLTVAEGQTQTYGTVTLDNIEAKDSIAYTFTNTTATQIIAEMTVYYKVVSQTSETGKASWEQAPGISADKTTYTQTLEKGRYSTICLPYAATVAGGVIYKLVNKSEGTYTDPETHEEKTGITSLIFEFAKGIKESESNEVEAGMAYLVKSLANDGKVVYTKTNETAADVKPVTDTNGFTGVYSTVTVAKDAYFFYNEVDNNNQLTGKQYFVMSNGRVKADAFRAYIKNMGAVRNTETAGAKKIVLGRFIDPTAIDEIDAANVQEVNAQNGKYFRNGRLVIVKNGKEYSTAGQVIK